MTDLAHGQVAAELGIYKPYYDRMRTEAPALCATNVNHWLHAQPKKRLVRTLDGAVRSFNSDGYRPLDNYDLLEALIPAVRDLGDVRVDSCEITEKRLYIKLVRPSLQWDAAMAKREALLAAGKDLHNRADWDALQKADVVQAATTIRNSEVGCGALAIESGLYKLTCLNLATMEVALRKAHVGRKHQNGNGNGDDVYHLLSDEARQADDKALWLRVRDVAKHTLSTAMFETNAKKWAGAAADRIGGDKVEQAAEVAAVKFGFSDATKAGVLKHLIESGDLSRLGLVNAVTRQSQDEKDYDAATDMERAGGALLAMASGEFRSLLAK